MEDVLEAYQRPYDPLRPVVCIDETNKQLIKEERIPCGPGDPEKVDSVYVRNGAADVFMTAEPPRREAGNSCDRDADCSGLCTDIKIYVRYFVSKGGKDSPCDR